jgi:cell division protein FtsQ
MNKTVKNIVLRISMLIGVTGFVLLLAMAKLNRDESKVRHIKISIDEWGGNYFVTKGQVLSLIENNYRVKNKTLSGKDLEHIERAVAVIPQVKTANAFTDDKGDLNIKIIQRVPLLRVYNIAGESFYVDEKGMKFPVSNYYAAKVPVVSGNILERCDSTVKIRSRELASAFSIAQSVNKNKVWHAMIGQYHVNEKGQVEMVPRFGNTTVLFGDEKNAADKLKRLDIFYFDVLKKIGWNYYRVINIMYKDQVICLK